MPDDAKYIVFIADVVDSSQLVVTERQDLQNDLIRLISELNERFQQRLRTKLFITGGDAIQAVVKDPVVIPDMAWDLWSALHRVDLQISVGFGRIFTEFNDDPRLMDGPAFHNAAKFAPRGAGLSFRGFGESQDAILNGLGAFLHTLFKKFTPRQREALVLLHDGGSQTAIADRLGVSKQAVSRYIKTSGWHAFKQGEDALRKALVLFTPQAASGNNT